MILFQTNPFWSSLLAVMCMGEKIMKVEIIALSIAFIGVILVAVHKADRNEVDEVNVDDPTIQY